MKNFYHNHSIKIITITLGIGMFIMYIGLSVFNDNLLKTNPTYTRSDVKKIEIKNFIGTLEIVTSDVAGFKLEFSNKKPDDHLGFYPLFKMGTPTIATIDGRFAPVMGCDITRGENSKIAQAFIQETSDLKLNINSYPTLKITTHKDLILDIRKSVIFGSSGDLTSVKMQDMRCSNFSFNSISGDVVLDLKDANQITGEVISGNLTVKKTSDNIVKFDIVKGQNLEN